MDSQHAWQAGISQLQMEMPKASFDTWVRCTELVEYTADTFTVGVQNAYARLVGKSFVEHGNTPPAA